MVNKILFFTLSFYVQIVSAQVNISFDNNCLKTNTIILSKALEELKGENFISDLLENNNSFIIFCDVDSLGHLVEVKKIRGVKKELPEGLKQEIISGLIANNVSFFICYEKPLNLTVCESYTLIRKSLLDSNITTYPINISFPGDMMQLYEDERSKYQESGIILSKYQYFKYLINNSLK